MEVSEKKFADIEEGNEVRFEVLIDEALVVAFSAMSGDTNPLHTDNAYAVTTTFGGRVAHGMVGGALFSRLVGMYMPGKYALYLSQTLFFKRPILLGTTVTVGGTVIHKSDATQTIQIATSIMGPDGGVCTDGVALVKLLA